MKDISEIIGRHYQAINDKKKMKNTDYIRGYIEGLKWCAEID